MCQLDGSENETFLMSPPVGFATRGSLPFIVLRLGKPMPLKTAANAAKLPYKSFILLVVDPLVRDSRCIHVKAWVRT
jgi:hypothetical protein